MKIQINDKDEVVSFLKFGDRSEQNLITISDDIVPEDFIYSFESCKYLYKDGQLILNENFHTQPLPIQKSAEEIISNLAQQLATSQILQAKTNAQLIQQNAMLVKQVADLQSEKETTNG